ncbi:Protein charlatan [Harpegnathos saltator]|uniref:Protein charlatan n=2 Tax=Harpegnathos saltator TaxID=610380 RepID=E2C4F4_HARSA|nr:Protein charlatan [Harpegnathos saltator]
MSQTIPPSTSISTRYNCQYCSYGTNRRDLLMRHEMIHREDKPFWCHECEKFFSRADHVKKHVARMHRGSTYDPTRIRRLLEPATHNQIEALGPSNSLNDPQQRQSVDYQPFTDTRAYHLQPTPGTRNEMYQAPTMQNIASGISLFEPGSTRRGQYSGGHNDSHTKNNSKTERSSVVGDCTPPEPPVFPALAQPIAQPCSSAEVQATNIYLSLLEYLQISWRQYQLIREIQRMLHNTGILPDNTQNEESQDSGLQEPIGTYMTHTAPIQRLHGQNYETETQERTRRRKQLHSKKVVRCELSESNGSIENWLCTVDSSNSPPPVATEIGTFKAKVNFKTNNVQSRKVSLRLFRYILCQRHGHARYSLRRLYIVSHSLCCYYTNCGVTDVE